MTGGAPQRLRPATAETWRAFALLRAFRRDRLGTLQRVAQRHGAIGVIQLGPRRIVLVNDPRYVHAVLVEYDDHFRKSPGLRIHTRPVLGNGLLLSEGDLHRRQRRLVAPAFRPTRIGAYADTMTTLAEAAQAGWRDGVTLDISEAMGRLTQEIAATTLFGSAVATEGEELRAALAIAMRDAAMRAVSPLQIPLHWPTRYNRRVRAAIARLDVTVRRMIVERRRSGEERGDLLSLLLRATDDEDGGGMSDRLARDEAMTLFLAGHETTANALTWTWYLLSQHPAVYRRLQREVDRVLGGRTPTVEDLPQLPYTAQVFKEAMRLYPPAYAVLRQALRPVHLGPYTVERDGIVMIATYTIHRRADLFADPLRFDPERFTPEGERAIPRLAYLPFGAGSRVCIGSHFALMEGQLVVATLAQRVAFDPMAGPPAETDPLITLRPRGAVLLTVRRRA